MIATGDLHLGMKFTSYPEVRSELVAARFEALGTIVAKANELGAELILIAGDLFDRPGVAERDVEKCVSLLAAFEGSVIAVLPGNHDYYNGTDSAPWMSFEARCADAKCSVLLLNEPRVYDLASYDLNIRLLPAPCTAKHRNEHAIGWAAGAVDSDFDLSEDVEEPTVIGVAHGSVESVSPDLQGQYYPMAIADFQRTPAHLWIVGHTHAQSRMQTRPGQELFIPGTPEPDGFDCGHSGGIWEIEVEAGRIIRAESHRSGTYRFYDRDYRISTNNGLDDIDEDIRRTTEKESLFRISVDGTLSTEAFARYHELRESWVEALFYFQADDRNLTEELTKDLVEEKYPAGSFPHKLLCSLLDSDDLEAAQTAARLLEENRASTS